MTTMEKFDDVCQDLIGVPGIRFRTALQHCDFDFYKSNGDINTSKVSEMMGLLFKYKEKNPDTDIDELLDYVDTYASICEDDIDFYIFNNKEHEEVFRRIAIIKDSIYNPLQDVVAVEERCPKCGGKNARFWQVQIRGLDEPPTSFYRCLNQVCGAQWKG